MAKHLSEFKKVNGLDDIFTADNGSLRCSAVRLTTGGLCLFSPVLGLSEAAMASLAELGKVEFLLAPNHYHNKGLAEYKTAFPNASLCAPTEARSRLKKITGFKFTGLDALQGVLPDNVHLVYTQGLKTGEIWIRAVGTRCTAWLVVDAFSGPKGKPGNIAGEPDMLGSFPKFGVGDRACYIRWVAAQIRDDKPTMLLPCHGGVVSSPRLAKKLQNLIKEKL